MSAPTTTPRKAKQPKTIRVKKAVAELSIGCPKSNRRLGRLVAWFLEEQVLMKTTGPTPFGAVVTQLLFEFIQAEALRTAQKRRFRERDNFAASAPAFILFPLRKTVTTRPLELYQQDQPFLPWLRTVLANLLNSELGGRRTVSDAELLARLPDDEGTECMGDGSAPVMFPAELCEKMEEATTCQRLVIFLAMTGLYQNHPDWAGLLGRYVAEGLKPKQKPRRKLTAAFPSIDVDQFATPRRRTLPLSVEMGLRANTVSKNFERAKKDLAHLFPEPVKPRSRTTCA